MNPYQNYFDSVYREIIANSLFTERQIYIIFNRLSGSTVHEAMSRGAYYRQLKQSRLKINGVLYSLLLLKSIEAIDQQTFSILETICNQLRVILSKQSSDIIDDNASYNVISTIDQIIRKMSKV